MNQTDRPSPIETVDPNYPALTALARHSAPIAWGATILVFIAVASMTYAALGVTTLVVAAIVAAFVYGVARVFGDIARLMVDTLVPK